MGYESPSLQELINFSKTLTKLAQDPTKKNPQRLAFATLYAKFANIPLSEPADPKKELALKQILLGMLVSENEWIANEPKYYYTGTSPMKKKGWVYETGSEIYTAIHNFLFSNPDNVMGDDERLMYSFKFYQQAQLLNEKELPGWRWNHSDTLLADITFCMKQFRKKESDRIALLISDLPSLLALQKILLKLPAQYQENRLYGNPKRRALIDFMLYVGECFEVKHPIAELVKKDEYGKQNAEKDEAYLKAQYLHSGLILFALMKINKESWFNPEGTWLTNGSEVYKGLSPLKYLLKKSYDDKIEMFDAILEQIKKVQKSPQLYQTPTKSRNAAQLKNIDELAKEVDAYLVKLKLEKAKPSKAISYAKTATSYAVQGLLAYGLPSVAAALIGGVAGPVVFVIYGTAGTIIMTQMGRLVGANMVPTAVASLYSWVLEKAGYAIADKTVGAVGLALSVSADGLRALLGHPNMKPENRAFIIDYINTLLCLPDEVYSAEEKKQIKTVWGIEERLEDNFYMMRR